MLPKSYRLPSSEIPRVMKCGKRVIGQEITLIYSNKRQETSDKQSASRFAFIVSTKIDKRATRRNRMKRLLSESVAHLLPRLHGTVDYIFIVKKDFSGMPQPEVESMVAGVLNI